MSDQFATVGDRLRAARSSCGLTQEFVASKIGVTKATYGRYESGGLTAPSDVFARIVRVFQEATSDSLVTADLLLFGETTSGMRADCTQPIHRIRKFGAMVGMIFGHEASGLNGGYAEISFSGGDAWRILLAFREAEEQKAHTNKGALKTLERAGELLLDSEIEFVAEVPIAQYAVRLVPRFVDDAHLPTPVEAKTPSTRTLVKDS